MECAPVLRDANGRGVPRPLPSMSQPRPPMQAARCSLFDVFDFNLGERIGGYFPLLPHGTEIGVQDMMAGRREPHFLQDDLGFYTTSYGPFVLRYRVPADLQSER
jgi:hypothetical protein